MSKNKTKICSWCKIRKYLKYFQKDKYTKDRLRSHCKLCDKQYREKNSSKLRETARKSRIKNAESIKAKGKVYRSTKEHKAYSKRKSKEYYIKNKEKINKRSKKWVKNNREKARQNRRNHYLNNIDKSRENTRRWRLENIDRSREIGRATSRRQRKKNPGKKNALEAKRYAAKMKRLPSYANTEAIKQFYINCPEGMWVDHIIPLQGKNISGFHIIQNLQYLTPLENIKKSNKFPYYPLSFYRKKGLIF